MGSIFLRCREYAPPPRQGLNGNQKLPRCARIETCLVANIGGKDSVKGNRQGFLSRLITRRSDQNSKI